MKSQTRRTGTALATDDASRVLLATLARWTGGLSPQAFGGAWINVLTRLAVAPGIWCAAGAMMLATLLLPGAPLGLWGMQFRLPVVAALPGSAAVTAPVVGSPLAADLLSALLNLGYRPQAAESAAATALADPANSRFDLALRAALALLRRPAS